MRRCDKNCAAVAAVAFAAGILLALCGWIKLIVFLSAVLVIWIAVSMR